MKSYLLTFLAAILMPCFAYAESEIDCIWIKHANNTYSCVLLESNPQIEFEDESLKIDSKSYLIEDIVSYRFGNSREASLSETLSDDLHIVFKDNVIEIYNGNGNLKNSNCAIYDNGGIALKNVPVRNSASPILIDVSDLSAGIYFLEISGTTFKFLKK